MLKKIIGRNISIIYRHEYQYSDVKLKNYNINKIQAEVLFFIRDNDNVNNSKINDFFHFNKATITKIITSLENNGYVTRISNTRDQRYKSISLTEKGKNIIPNIKEILQEYEKILIKDIPKEDIEKISSILVQMVENITEEKEGKNGKKNK